MSSWLYICLAIIFSLLNEIDALASTIKNVSPLRQLTTSQKFEKAAANEAVIYIDGK